MPGEFILFLGGALVAHALPSLGDLGEDILTGNVSHPQHAKADGKVGSISPNPVFGGSYHGNHERAGGMSCAEGRRAAAEAGSVQGKGGKGMNGRRIKQDSAVSSQMVTMLESLMIHDINMNHEGMAA